MSTQLLKNTAIKTQHIVNNSASKANRRCDVVIVSSNDDDDDDDHNNNDNDNKLIFTTKDIKMMTMVIMNWSRFSRVQVEEVENRSIFDGFMKFSADSNRSYCSSEKDGAGDWPQC